MNSMYSSDSDLFLAAAECGFGRPSDYLNASPRRQEGSRRYTSRSSLKERIAALESMYISPKTSRASLDGRSLGKEIQRIDIKPPLYPRQNDHQDEAKKNVESEEARKGDGKKLALPDIPSSSCDGEQSSQNPGKHQTRTMNRRSWQPKVSTEEISLLFERRNAFLKACTGSLASSGNRRASAPGNLEPADQRVSPNTLKKRWTPATPQEHLLPPAFRAIRSSSIGTSVPISPCSVRSSLPPPVNSPRDLTSDTKSRTVPAKLKRTWPPCRPRQEVVRKDNPMEVVPGGVVMSTRRRFERVLAEIMARSTTLPSEDQPEEATAEDSIPSEVRSLSKEEESKPIESELNPCRFSSSGEFLPPQFPGSRRKASVQIRWGGETLYTLEEYFETGVELPFIPLLKDRFESDSCGKLLTRPKRSKDTLPLRPSRCLSMDKYWSDDEDHEVGEDELENSSSLDQCSPVVWITTMDGTDLSDKKWRLKRVWNIPEMDEFESEHSADDEGLRQLLKSLLGVPAGESLDQVEPGLIPNSNAKWKFKKVWDVDGEIESSESEETFDEEDMLKGIHALAEDFSGKLEISFSNLGGNSSSDLASAAHDAIQAFTDRSGPSSVTGDPMGTSEPVSQKAIEDNAATAEATPVDIGNEVMELTPTPFENTNAEYGATHLVVAKHCDNRDKKKKKASKQRASIADLLSPPKVTTFWWEEHS